MNKCWVDTYSTWFSFVYNLHLSWTYNGSGSQRCNFKKGGEADKVGRSNHQDHKSVSSAFQSISVAMLPWNSGLRNKGCLLWQRFIKAVFSMMFFFQIECYPETEYLGLPVTLTSKGTIIFLWDYLQS